MTDRTMTASEAKARERQSPDPVRYYWLPWSKVYHVVLGGRLAMCGMMVKPEPDGDRQGWQLTAFRPRGHRVCFACLYARETWPWMLRR